MLKEARELRRYQLGLVTRAEVWTLQAQGNGLRSQPSNLKVTETQPRCRRALPNPLVMLTASPRHRADLLLSAELRFAKGLATDAQPQRFLLGSKTCMFPCPNFLPDFLVQRPHQDYATDLFLYKNIEVQVGCSLSSEPLELIG